MQALVFLADPSIIQTVVVKVIQDFRRYIPQQRMPGREIAVDCRNPAFVSIVSVPADIAFFFFNPDIEKVAQLNGRLNVVLDDGELLQICIFFNITVDQAFRFSFVSFDRKSGLDVLGFQLLGVRVFVRQPYVEIFFPGGSLFDF